MFCPSTMPDASPLRLSTLLERGARLQPDNLLVEKTATGYSTTSYAAHAVAARALALALQASGVARGHRVATFCWNTNRHLACYHAIPLMGAVCHPLNIRLGPTELAWILGHADDRVAIVDAVLLDVFSRIPKEGLAGLHAVVVCGVDDTPGGWQHTDAARALAGKVPQVVDWDDFLRPCEDAAAKDFARGAASLSSTIWPEDIPECAACSMCYTSGTTGHPKGVLYSHRSTFIHTLAMPAKNHHNLGGEDVILPVVPYFHANGWGLPFLALMLGARLLHNGRFTDAETILQMAVDWGATYSAAVPAIWATARQTLEANPSKYKAGGGGGGGGGLRLQSIVCGGSAPSPEMMSWYKREYGVQFTQGWGMTETSPMGSNGKAQSKFKHIAWSEEQQFANVSVAGIPAAGLEMRIVDSDDFTHALPTDGNAQGELLVRGPWVTSRYHKIDKPEAFVKGGWLATGDVASIDPDGNLIIRDRSKDVIKSGGEWISSIDLEKFIIAMKARNGTGLVFSMVAVVAQPHPKWDERPVAVVVLAPGASPTEATTARVRAFCAGSFAKYELVDDVLLWEEFPMTGTGKVDKKAIRAKLATDGYRLPSLRSKI
jgi:fatty-acyl-CoA synthase